jgi:hypothetical protein
MSSQPLYLELVPFVEAMAAANHTLFPHGRNRRRAGRTDGLRRELGLALAALAPIYTREAQRPLAFSEVQARLCASDGAPSATAQLGDLYIRRCDLLRSVELLKESAEPLRCQG